MSMRTLGGNVNNIMIMVLATVLYALVKINRIVHLELCCM